MAELGRTPSGFDPWNKSLLVQSETQRRLGDKDLFAGIDFSWREAQSAYMQAEPAYRAIPRRLAILRSMQEHRDLAFIHLPGWGPYLIAQSRVDRQELDTWQEGLPAARDLADALERKDPNALDSEPTSLSSSLVSDKSWLLARTGIGTGNFRIVASSSRHARGKRRRTACRWRPSMVVATTFPPVAVSTMS